VDSKSEASVVGRSASCIFKDCNCIAPKGEEEPSYGCCARCQIGIEFLDSDKPCEKMFNALRVLSTRNMRIERSNRRMGLLLDIFRLVQSADDLETTLRTILTCVTSGYSIGFNRAFLFLLDADEKRLRGAIAVGPRSGEEAHEIWTGIRETAESLEDIVASSRAGGREGDAELTRLVKRIRLTIGDNVSLLERCLTEEGTITVDDPSELDEGDALRALSPKAFVCTPIMRTGNPLGIIVADNLITGEIPSEEQVNLLEALACQVGQAIANASHHEEIERRYQELSTLNEVGKGILGITDLEDDLCLIARISAQVLNAKGAVVRLVDDATGSLSLKAMYGMAVGEVSGLPGEGAQAIAENVARDGKPILIRDTAVYRDSDPELARRRNLICVPMIKGRKVIGTLTVFDKVRSEPLGEERFERGDLRFVAVLAGQAAIAIENAKLFDKVRQSQQRIRELHQHLLRSERLAALGELSTQVAHEIRNPLTAIGGFARSMEAAMEPDDPNRSYLGIVVKETERLERILSEHLSFAKLSPPQFELGDINEVIRETTSLFSEKLTAKKVHFSMELSQDIPKAFLDANKMKQVFINLVQNALDSISDGGSIGVTSGRLDRTIEVRFTNDGPPISPEIIDRLFVPFATTKASGSGLGLPIAYEIVYEHGGNIDVRSDAESGTVFLITLPIVVEGDRRKGPVDRRGSIRDRRKSCRAP
jgi:signal transduction histidine kinase